MISLALINFSWYDTTHLLGDGLGGGVEEAKAHLQQTLLLPGEGQLEEGVECGGEAEDEGGGGVEPGQLGHEQQHLVVQVVLQVLAHNLNKEEIVIILIHCCSLKFHLCVESRA